MKKLVLFLVLAVLMVSVFVLAACGGGEAAVAPAAESPVSQEVGNGGVSQPAPVDPAPGEVTAPPEADEPVPAVVHDFAFKMGDVLIEMNQNITDVIDKLGEPLGVFEAPSCAFDGIDRIYSYPGVQLYTYPVGDEDFIHTIGFFDDSIKTTEGGIRLGSTLQAVLDAYGDDYEYDTGMYTFARGRTRLEFLIEDDTVIGLSYGFIIEP